jgi:signal transduction histidine kinase
MRAEQLFQHLAEVLYVVIFAAVVLGALRRPTRARLDMVLFFGVTAVIVLASELLALLQMPTPVVVSNAETALIMTLPYLLLRLVADFIDIPRRLVLGAEVGLAAAVVSLLFIPPPLPSVLVLLMVAYFVGLSLYASFAFMRGSRRAGGVTRRRLQAVALGSVFLGLDILVAGLAVLDPARADIWDVFGPLAGMASGLAYVLGFAPPTWLRRAWQEPEVRAFLERAATLPHLPTTRAIVAELERGAAAAAGGSGATIGLWDEAADILRFFDAAAQASADASARAMAARVLRDQQAFFSDDITGEGRARAAASGSTAAVAAPITAGARRLGVLVVYAGHAPIFADSDVELVQLLADQAAVILESRKLLDAAALAQARTEAARLKEDFLSSAAHDLKTPIAGILTQAQVLQRRLEVQAVDARVPGGVARIIGEARRLSALVLELLDVSLLEQGRLLTTRESVNLIEVASGVCERHGHGAVACRVDAPESVIGTCDPIRIRQLVEHLVDNAVKFSPADGEVVLRVWRELQDVRLDVVDQGIGIPPDDLPRLFERFHRGSNVDDRRFAGLGLGLYLSRGIAEQHGGRIWATSNPGGGSTFSVSLPLHGVSRTQLQSAFATGVEAPA